MPEGPEVKIVADFLNKKLKNKTITDLNYCSKSYKKKYELLIKELSQFTPIKFEKVFCIGKASFLKIDKHHYFSYHLGMTGKWSEIKEKHSHLIIKTSDQNQLYFTDTRRFGNIKLLKEGDLLKKYPKERDLLNYNTSIKKNVDFLIKNIQTNQEVCKVLLNQKYFCGVGNYLKSEILYHSKIHPHKRWSDLNRKEITNLCMFTREIMKKAYMSGGAELRDFKNPKKDSKLQLNAYGKKIDSKKRLIVNDITKDQRRTYWCPKIQKI
jgi:DNA-formamidopyrimidine glycosylase